MAKLLNNPEKLCAYIYAVYLSPDPMGKADAYMKTLGNKFVTNPGRAVVALEDSEQFQDLKQILFEEFEEKHRRKILKSRDKYFDKFDELLDAGSEAIANAEGTKEKVMAIKEQRENLKIPLAGVVAQSIGDDEERKMIKAKNLSGRLSNKGQIQ